MGLNILKYLVITLTLSNLSQQQSTPSERCEENGNGTLVCMDCFTAGMCLLMDGTYTVTEAIICPTDPFQSYCDDTLFGPENYGLCSPIGADTTDCGCSTTTQCIADPNDPAVILHCEESPPVSDEACSPPAIDLNTCSCLSCSEACPLLDDPNDDCESYFVCSGTELISVTCIDGLCFDQQMCGCADTGGVSSELPSSAATETISLMPTTAMTCPEGCPFLDDPNDNCGSYFVCSGDELIPLTCTGTLCFDQTMCGCLDTGASSTESPITDVTEPATLSSPETSVTCPEGCPFLDDPNDDCANYFVCSGGELIPLTCTGTLCFDQEMCGCLDTGASSTELPTTKVTGFTTTPLSPVTSVTCPPGCPLLDDPDDSCGNYFVCDGGELIPVQCTGTLCFDQAECGCVDRGASSIETPTTKVTVPTTTPLSPVTSVTCPPGCPLLDDPDDSCGNYFVCSGGELIPVQCTGTLCFDQAECGCLDRGASSIETPTTKVTVPTTTPLSPVTSVTCPPGCPLLDDPDDSCGKYFVCSGGDLIPLECTGTLCFDQEMCGCLDTGASSIEPTTTLSPVTSVTCPPGCPFLDDPNDSCGNYFVCSDGELIPIKCTGTLCFDQAECGCLDTGASSTVPPTTRVTIPTTTTTTAATTTTTASTTTTSPPVTSVTCPPGCPFLDDPDDSCANYFVCTGSALIPVSCTGTLCFDQSLCGCIDTGGPSTEQPTTKVTIPITTTTPPTTTPSTTTTTPTTTTPSTTTTTPTTTTITTSTIPPTPTTCPPGCPFVDDPYDNCARFYICNGGAVVPSQCPGILCFDQATCQCK